MKTLIALVGLSLVCLAGCQARSTAEVDALNAKLQAEQTKIGELTQRADEAAAAVKTAAEKRVAEVSKQLDAAKKQAAEANQKLETLERQVTEAEKAKTAAEDQYRQASADNDLLKAKLAQRGTLRTIDDPVPADAKIPEEIRGAFRNALAWRANQIRSLEIEIRDTPSRVEARALQGRLNMLKSSPLTPPRLSPTELVLGQIGPLQIDDHLRVDEIIDATTLVVTPIKLDPTLSPQLAPLGSTSLGAVTQGTAFVREEGNPIAIHGFPTKGAVTGTKITKLPGLYFVEKTRRYGSRTIFVLAPVDANKLRFYFSRLQAEMQSTPKAKPRASGNEPVAK